MTVFTLVVSSGAKWVLALTLWKPDFQVHLLRLPIRDPPPFQSTHTHTNCTVLCTTKLRAPWIRQKREKKKQNEAFILLRSFITRNNAFKSSIRLESDLGSILELMF